MASIVKDERECEQPGLGETTENEEERRGEEERRVGVDRLIEEEV